jgi:hypothetical protein
MAEKISDLTAASASNLTDLTEVSQVSGPSYITRKATESQRISLYNNNIQLAATTQVTGFDTAVDARITAQKDIVNGIAGLDADKYIQSTAIPPTAVTAATYGGASTAISLEIQDDGRINAVNEFVPATGITTLVSTPYTALVSDQVLVIPAGSTAYTIIVPSALPLGQPLEVFNRSSVNATVNPDGLDIMLNNLVVAPGQAVTIKKIIEGSPNYFFVDNSNGNINFATISNSTITTTPIDTCAITESSINDTPIGDSTPSNATFTNLVATSTATVQKNIDGSGSYFTAANYYNSVNAAVNWNFQAINSASEAFDFSYLQLGKSNITPGSETGYAKLYVLSAGANQNVYDAVGSNITFNSNVIASSVAFTGGNIDNTVIGLTTRSNAQYLQPTRTITSSTTMLATDCSKFIYFNSAAAITITLPQQSTTTLAAGYGFNYKNLGAGTVTFVVEGSDVLRGNTTAQTNASGTIYLQNITTQNNWDNYGGTTVILTSTKIYIPAPQVVGTVPNYYFDLSSAKQVTYTSAKFIAETASGTNTVDLYANDVAITGGSLSPSTSVQTQSLTANNAVLVGQTLTAKVNAINTLTGLTVQLNGYYYQ